MTDPYQPDQPPAYQPPAYQPGPVTPPPPDPYAPQAYYPPQPVYPYGYQPPRPTEGLAIASLVVSCAAVLGLCFYGLGGILGLVGAILGHVARRKIAQTGAGGAGLALAGIITGWIVVGFAALALIGVLIVLAVNPDFS